MYIDSLCILKDSKHAALAMEFINYIHRPEVYAQFLDFFGFPAGVNPEAAQYMTVTPFYEVEELANCEIKEDLGEGLEQFNALWQDIRFTD
jgi:spermidine/putrescine transport system substrate-binding protein